VRWHGTGAWPDLETESRTLAFCLCGASQRDDDLYVMINASPEDSVFTIQDGSFKEWWRSIDTALDSPDDICEPCGDAALTSQEYRVRARSVVVLTRTLRADVEQGGR
jgi:glycogen operon protein